MWKKQCYKYSLKVCKILCNYNTMTYPYGASPDRFIAFWLFRFEDTLFYKIINGSYNGAYAIHGN